jgi:hypothetical protein
MGFYMILALMAVLFSIALALGAIQDLVLLRMKATAIFLLGQSVVGPHWGHS